MNEIDRILVSSEQIETRLTELANTLDAYYEDREVTLVCILKGSVVFFSELAKRLHCPVTFDFISASSYGSSTNSSGKLQMKKDLDSSIAGKNVLIVEDIIDTGNTLFMLKKMLLDRGPADLKICTLLDKPARRTADIAPDFIGFTIPDEFVVGYGLDYAEKYRNLPYVGVLSRCIYEKNAYKNK